MKSSERLNPEAKSRILDAARGSLLEHGYSGLSTRKVAAAADVPLSLIHYHFGSKRNMILELFEAENRSRLERQAAMFDGEMPLWKQWEEACNYLEEDLASGYVRVLNEVMAAGWADEEVAVAVRGQVRGWFDLLATVVARVQDRFGGIGLFTVQEVAALAGLPFLGAEMVILLGIPEEDLPARSALRKVALVIRSMEEGDV
ncbi:MAG: helix-turn-helix domain-containing protein [Actinomycetota bacterium]|nr:helix-turn-helix domain-containing protein [Actinomycetota bacterium]